MWKATLEISVLEELGEKLQVVEIVKRKNQYFWLCLWTERTGQGRECLHLFRVNEKEAGRAGCMWTTSKSGWEQPFQRRSGVQKIEIDGEPRFVPRRRRGMVRFDPEDAGEEDRWCYRHPAVGRGLFLVDLSLTV